MNPVKYRTEWKRQLSPSEWQILHSRLSALLYRDPHAGAKGGYQVRSLCFESTAQTWNADGSCGLFRLRFYNDDWNSISLEKKSRTEGRCCKAATPVTLAQCLDILRGNWRWLRDAEEPLLRELFWQMELNCLRPKTVISSWREAFLYPVGDVRIILDHQSQAELTASGFLTAYPPAVPTAACDTFLTVKYDQLLPMFIRLALQPDIQI